MTAALWATRGWYWVVYLWSMYLRTWVIPDLGPRVFFSSWDSHSIGIRHQLFVHPAYHLLSTHCVKYSLFINKLFQTNLLWSDMGPKSSPASWSKVFAGFIFVSFQSTRFWVRSSDWLIIYTICCTVCLLCTLLVAISVLQIFY